MCTAITYQTKDHYFGRNLDYEYDFGEAVTVTPRNFPFSFRCLPPMPHHYAMIGTAVVADSYPLYFDATNECGLSIAGLNFSESARYFPQRVGKDNVAPFELIPYLLGSCATVAEAEKKLKNIQIAAIAFSTDYPLSPLHWILADASRCLTVEQTQKGLGIYANPIGVLTNEPPFPYHMMNLRNYLNVTADEPVSRFAKGYPMEPCSRGMGGIGLPGDLSSPSRFIKAAFTKLNSVSDDAESASICQAFHILGSVAQQQGCVKVGDRFEKTLYTSCCNTGKGIYYYTTYENTQITGVNMHHTSLDSDRLSVYPFVKDLQIRMEN